MAPIRWSLGPGSHRWLRRCWYAGAAVCGGFLLVALGVGTAFAAGALWTGDPGPALFALLLVFVGGPLSILYLWPMLWDPAQRPAFLEPPPWLSARWLLVGSVVVATLFVAIPALGTSLFVTGLAMGLVAALLRTEGHLEPAAGTITVDVHEIDLRDLREARRLDLAGIAILWLGYADRAGAVTSRRFVVLPADAADRVHAAIERTDNSPPEHRSASESRPAVRLVLAAFGLGALAMAGGVHLLDSVPTNVALYGTAIFGLGGATFLWLAYAE